MCNMNEQKGCTAIRDRSEFREDCKEPKMYRVYLLNDDFTTFRFVVFVMGEIFDKTYREGRDIADYTHDHGKGLVGIYTYDLANTKVERAKALSRSYGYPLNFTIAPYSENGQ